MVRPTGFEPMAPRLGIWCSILLSYGRSVGGSRAAKATLQGCKIGMSHRFEWRQNGRASVQFVWWRNRKGQGHQGHAFVQQFLGLFSGRLAVNDFGFLLAVMHRPADIGEPVSDPA